MFFIPTSVHIDRFVQELKKNKIVDNCTVFWNTISFFYKGKNYKIVFHGSGTDCLSPFLKVDMYCNKNLIEVYGLENMIEYLKNVKPE